jgi:tRNA-dihydrouridine synthase B
MSEFCVTPLKIGKFSFKTNLIQAPLAGISCAPFRELIWSFGAIAYGCTEMQSARQIAQGGQRAQRYIHRGAQEACLCWQLSGNQPEYLAQASEIAAQSNADLLDLNCGCPMPKIRQKGCGSKLLSKASQLGKLIQAMKHASGLPVTIKIRVDSCSGDNNNYDVARMAEDSGADALVVHGRHWTEHYQTPCHLEDIAEIVQAVNIPVIGNGDITDYQSLATMLATTGCQGVMIGRASIGKPWLFKALTCADRGITFPTPAPDEIGTLLWRHICGLAKLEPEHIAVLQMRRLIKYYAATLPTYKVLQAAANQCTSLHGLQTLIQQYFGAIADSILLMK